MSNALCIDGINDDAWRALPVQLLCLRTDCPGPTPRTGQCHPKSNQSSRRVGVSGQRLSNPRSRDKGWPFRPGSPSGAGELGGCCVLVVKFCAMSQCRRHVTNTYAGRRRCDRNELRRSSSWRAESCKSHHRAAQKVQDPARPLIRNQSVTGAPILTQIDPPHLRD